MNERTQICVLADPQSWHYRDLQRAAGARLELASYSFSDLWARVGTPDLVNCNPLQQFDVIFARAMPVGSLQQVVFRMDVLLAVERNGVRVVNPPRAIEASVDKFLALSRMAEQSIPVPRTAVSQTVGEAIEQYFRLGADVVFKPMFGSMGKGLRRIQTVEEAERMFASAVDEGDVIYQQKFLRHDGSDFRLLVIGNDVLGMKRENPHHWITNIAQGGRGFAHRPSEMEKDLARRAARSVGAIVAGIDLVYDRQTGQPYVVEVNSAPAWQAISRVLEVDVAKMILSELQRSAAR